MCSLGKMQLPWPSLGAHPQALCPKQLTVSADGVLSSVVLPGHQRLQVIQQGDTLLACLVEVPCDETHSRRPITGSFWESAQQLRVVANHANDQKLHKRESKEFMK